MEFDSYKFTVYFYQKNPRSHVAAYGLRRELMEAAKRNDPAIHSFGHVNDGPEGPHPIGNFEVTVAKTEISRAITWFMLHHGTCSVMLRPSTKDKFLDFTERAMWLGTPLALDLASIVEDLPSGATTSNATGGPTQSSPRELQSTKPIAPTASPVSVSFAASTSATRALSPSAPVTVNVRKESQPLDSSPLLSPRTQLASAEVPLAVTVDIKAIDLIDAKMAIVYPANNWLKLIAGNIKDGAGDTVQQELDKIIKSNGDQPLPIGSSVVTKSGSLGSYCIPFIVHAIAMGYASPSDPKSRIPATADTVSQAVTSAMEAADRMSITQLAFMYPMCHKPGYNSVQPEGRAYEVLCASMMEAVKRFRGRRLRKVLLCQQPNIPLH